MLSRILPIQMVPSVTTSLLSLSRSVMATGKGAASLAEAVAARVACKGGQVVFICGDNRFDPYAISRLARS